MRLSDSALKGVLPSKAWRTMPSSRSPSDMSWYSARALRTLRRRFAMRTPVWTRWMTSWDSLITVRMYHGTSTKVKPSVGAPIPPWRKRRARTGNPPCKFSGACAAIGFEDKNSVSPGGAFLDFQLAVRTVGGFAVDDRVVGGKQGLSDVEQVFNHARGGIGLLGEANFRRGKLSHAVGLEGAGLRVPTNADPQGERVKSGGKHFARGNDKAFGSV